MESGEGPSHLCRWRTEAYENLLLPWNNYLYCRNEENICNGQNYVNYIIQEVHAVIPLSPNNYLRSSPTLYRIIKSSFKINQLINMKLISQIFDVSETVYWSMAED